MGKIATIDIQIRFGDVDGLGHINNARIQEYFDLAKMDFYSNSIGNEIMPDRVSPVIVSVKTDYFAQSRLYDRLYVETSVEEIGNKSVRLFQRLLSRDDSQVRAECRTVAVTYDFVTGESVGISDAWREALSQYIAE